MNKTTLLLILILCLLSSLGISCKKTCDKNDPNSDCYVEPTDQCASLRLELAAAVTDSINAANTMIDAEEYAMAGSVLVNYIPVFNWVCREFGLPAETLLDKAIVHRIAIPKFLELYPNLSSKDALITFDEACELYIKEHNRPSQKRLELSNCEVLNSNL